MITKITPAQKARLGEWAEKWTAIGLSTEPADFEKAEQAALRMYDLAGVKRPLIVLRMGSPYGATLGGVLAWAMLREMFPGGHVRSQVGRQVWSQVWSQVRSQVWNQVGSQVGSQVWNQVRSQVRSQVESQVGRQVWSQLGSQVQSQVWSQVRNQVERQIRNQVRNQVWSQVGSQVWSQVWSQVQSQVWSQVQSQVEHQVWSQVQSQVEHQVRSQVQSQVWSHLKEAPYNSYHGAFWAAWGAYISFIRDVLGWSAPVIDRFSLEEELITSCGCVWWHENVLAISDRPRVINRDRDGNLHSAAAPSIAYRDGWALWHWHGKNAQARLEACPLAYASSQLHGDAAVAELVKSLFGDGE